MSVTRQQRHTRAHRCPVCDGADEDAREAGKRCSGFTSEDGLYVHCSREEHAGAISANSAGLFAHRMKGTCNCGTSHGPWAPSSNRNASAETTYDYKNESGTLVFQVVRKPGKRFAQRRPDGAGGWIWNTREARRVLYRLPELLAADAACVVYVVEGEKDVETLLARGHVATTNPGGAGKWRAVAETARRALRGRDVVVVADADEPGRAHALSVASSLQDVARSLRVVEPPQPHKDATDLLVAGGVLTQLITIASASTTPDDEEKPTVREPLRGLQHLSAVAVVGRSAIRELAEKPIVYVWTDIAIVGTIVLIAGAPAEGKTTLLFLILAARMNTGAAVCLLSREILPAPPGRWIVIIEGEHSEASTARKLVRSLALLGVDDAALDRVIIAARKAVQLRSPEWDDVERLVAAGLVSDIAIDTLARVAPADANDEREQAAIFDQIAQSIERAPPDADKPIVWTVSHTRKNNTTGELADVSGSVQRTGQADSVLLIKGEKVAGRTVSTCVTFAKLREDPDDYPKPVTFSISPNERGEPSIRIVAGATGDDDRRSLEVRVLEQLRDGPRTKNALCAKLHRNATDVDAVISNLFSSKAIRTTTLKVRGRDCKAFELRHGPSHPTLVRRDISQLSPDGSPDETTARGETGPATADLTPDEPLDPTRPPIEGGAVGSDGANGEEHEDDKTRERRAQGERDARILAAFPLAQRRKAALAKGWGSAKIARALAVLADVEAAAPAPEGSAAAADALNHDAKTHAFVDSEQEQP